MIQEITSQSRIQTKVDAKTWQESIRIAGNILLEHGDIEAKYIDAMIDKVLEFGQYIVIAPGIAMPHARPEEGVIRTSIALMTLKEPVVFGHRQNDPVRIIICLAAKDNTKHLEALSDIADIFGDENKLETILAELDPKVIYDML